ncbi:Hypothetical predicted protein [Olea europaea subsp. europaea]|uniref:Uncharacterized protein n=1 Tax=Olea europaea subsp. europaea TaxID=158383 RepID=A0A8S0TFJ9_OLEEU|nr:Hypothetical predicted protein [Olea europaea subsp. europaea]
MIRSIPVLAKDKDKVKEVVNALSQRWTSIKKKQKRLDGTSDVISYSVPHMVLFIVPSIPISTVTIAQIVATHTTPINYTTLLAISITAPQVTTSLPLDHSTVVSIKIDT